MTDIMGKESDPPLIYGTEHQARAICSQNVPGGSDSSVRFLVGTQSLQTPNQVHLIEYSEDRNSIAKAIFRHEEGEVWHISCSSKNPRLIATCYSPTSISKDQKVGSMCSLFEIPIDASNPINEEECIGSLPLKKLRDFKSGKSSLSTKT